MHAFIGQEDTEIAKVCKERLTRKAFFNPVYFSYNLVDDKTIIQDKELLDFANKYGYDGKNYKSVFKKEVYLNCHYLERLVFSNCNFESTIFLSFIDDENESVEFHNGIDFENCIFNNEIKFRNFISGTMLPDNKYYHNARETNFKGCTFKKKVDFSNSKFCNDIYFNNSIFKDFADFHECEFKNNACFYGVIFEKTPNFSQALFKDNLNIVNTKMSFNFEITRETIKKIEEDFNSKRMDKKKLLENFANDFRDSFRLFKNALSKEGNILDASNYHRVELYCKEIELDSKPDKKLQDKIDQWQLWFYRKTSDHHTNLAKIINSVIVLIALFGFFGYTITTYKEKHLNYERQYFGSIMGSAVDLSIRKESYSLTKTDKMELENRVNLDKTEAFLIVLLCLLFVILFIVFIAFTNAKCKIVSWLFSGVAYIMFFCVIAYKPTLLLPFFGQLFDEGLKTNFPAMQSLSVVYCILMVLMTFSLQKTARKNSIIPS